VCKKASFLPDWRQKKSLQARTIFQAAESKIFTEQGSAINA
jgi:hypothetical protein